MGQKAADYYELAENKTNYTTLKVGFQKKDWIVQAGKKGPPNFLYYDTIWEQR